MDVAQTIYGGDICGIALRRCSGQALRPPEDDYTQGGEASSARPYGQTGMGRAFSWAIAFHVVAVLGLVGMIEYWPVTPPRPGPINLDLDVLAASPAATMTAVEAPAWVQAVAAVAPEFRTSPVMQTPVPDAAAPVAVSDFVVVPAVEAPERLPGLDLAHENTRALSSLPLWAPSQASAVSNSAPREQGGVEGIPWR